jgi:hypothetical protein
MQITRSPTRLVVSDTPGCVWLLGLVFVASGTLVLTVPLFATEWAGFGWWERAAVLAIGASHLGGGLWTIRHHPESRTELDLASGTGIHHIRRLGQRAATITRFRLADVRDVAVVESTDSDGDPVFMLRLRLSGGRELPLQGHPAAGQVQARERADTVRHFLGLAALRP